MTDASDLSSRLRRTAGRRPDSTAFVAGDHRCSYGELDRRADAGAGGLRSLGVEPGDRVALVLGTVPTFVEAFYAALRAGAVVVPLNPDLSPDELRHALADSGAVAAVAGDATVAALAGLRDELPDLAALVGDTDRHGGPAWSELLAAGHEPPQVTRDADDLAALVYTSGTTGRPRGAMLTHANLSTNQDQSLAGRVRLGPEDHVLIVLPLSHIYALNVGMGGAVSVGASMVLVDGFDPVSALRTVEREGVTVVLGAPPIYLAWLSVEGTERFDLSSVRHAVSGAMALPPTVFRRFRAEFGVTIDEGYGLTEASPSVTSNAMADAPRAGSVGLPLPDVELRLVDDDGREAEVGDTGEVWVRGPNVFAGYWQASDATAEALTADGWLRTGDVAVRDEDGFVYLVDRKRDLIIVSGFNVYPAEVERVLREHPAVLAAAVIGVEHPYSGEVVKAWVVRDPDDPVTSAELLDHCAARLARYKVPRQLEFVDDLPTTPGGKVRRTELRTG